MKESKTAKSVGSFFKRLLLLDVLLDSLWRRKCSMVTTVQGVFLPIETVFHQMRRKKKSNTRAKCPECEHSRDILMSSPQAYPSHDTSYFFCFFAAGFAALLLLLFFFFAAAFAGSYSFLHCFCCHLWCCLCCCFCCCCCCAAAFAVLPLLLLMRRRHVPFSVGSAIGDTGRVFGVKQNA